MPSGNKSWSLCADIFTNVVSTAGSKKLLQEELNRDVVKNQMEGKYVKHKGVSDMRTSGVIVGCFPLV